VPKGTPNEIVTKLNSTINKILSKQEIKDAWSAQGAVPMIMSPSEFTKYLETDVAKWANVVKTAKIKPD
jgi:tripartite-type tricarboxylate transporter receptor subunit TctC